MPRWSAVGYVTSTKMAKTAVVSVTRALENNKYPVILRKTKKFFCHDEEEACRIDDFVRFEESRPYSKKKRFRVTDIVRAAPLPVQEELDGVNQYTLFKVKTRGFAASEEEEEEAKKGGKKRGDKNKKR